jgi:hypothetical protein
MRSVEEHRTWLSENKRYGLQIAAEFYSRAKNSGDDYLQYQVHYFPAYPGGSGWFDVAGITGLAESDSKQVRSWTCDVWDHPFLLMIGIEARAVRNGTLYVSRKKNISTIISLSRLSETNMPIAMRLKRSNRLVCADLRAAEFDDDHRKCADVSSFFKR